MIWLAVIVHVLFHTDTSFFTLQAMKLGRLEAVFLAIGVSSLAILFLNFGNRQGINYLSRQYKFLEKIRLLAVLYINVLGDFVAGKIGLKLFLDNANGSSVKMQKTIQVVSYKMVDRLGYTGVAILNLVPVVPFAQEAGLLGGQLIGLKNTLAVSLLFNALRIIILSFLFF